MILIAVVVLATILTKLDSKLANLMLFVFSRNEMAAVTIADSSVTKSSRAEDVNTLAMFSTGILIGRSFKAFQCVQRGYMSIFANTFLVKAFGVSSLIVALLA